MEKIEQVELDRALKPTENTATLTQTVRVVTDSEGFVHFAWRLKFDEGSYPYGATELITFLHVAGEAATVREERDFSVEVQNRTSWQPLFEYLHRQSQEGFSVPYGERRSRIGFLARE